MYGLNQFVVTEEQRFIWHRDNRSTAAFRWAAGPKLTWGLGPVGPWGRWALGPSATAWRLRTPPRLSWKPLAPTGSSQSSQMEAKQNKIIKTTKTINQNIINVELGNKNLDTIHNNKTYKS